MKRSLVGIAGILLVFGFILLGCEEKIKDETCTVKYNLNGGNGTTPDPITVHKGYTILLPDGKDLTNPPLAYEGWNTNSDGSGINYKGGSYINLNEDITLYAKWSLPIVTYHLNGGSGTTPESQNVEVGTVITLPKKGDIVRDGYEFGGWSTNTTGYDASSSTYTVKGHVTLYARWNKIYTVTYTAGGGTGTPPEPHKVASGSSIFLRANTFTNGSLPFTGWYSPNVTVIGLGSNILQPGVRVTVYGDISFTAQWW